MIAARHGARGLWLAVAALVATAWLAGTSRVRADRREVRETHCSLGGPRFAEMRALEAQFACDVSGLRDCSTAASPAALEARLACEGAGLRDCSTTRRAEIRALAARLACDASGLRDCSAVGPPGPNALEETEETACAWRACPIAPPPGIERLAATRDQLMDEMFPRERAAAETVTGEVYK